MCSAILMAAFLAAVDPKPQATIEAEIRPSPQAGFGHYLSVSLVGAGADVSVITDGLSAIVDRGPGKATIVLTRKEAKDKRGRLVVPPATSLAIVKLQPGEVAKIRVPLSDDLLLAKEPPGAAVVKTTSPEAEEDPFAESDARLAAQVRQMLRAHQAGDAEAIEVEMTYFDPSLTLTVRRRLHLIDHIWDGAQRWFDGLVAEPEFPAPNRLRLRGELYWVIGQEHWYYDPFDFEMELCPTTGAFRSYVIRFGDDRPLSAKVSGSATSGAPSGDWVFVIERPAQLRRQVARIK